MKLKLISSLSVEAAKQVEKNLSFTNATPKKNCSKIRTNSLEKFLLKIYFSDCFKFRDHIFYSGLHLQTLYFYSNENQYKQPIVY